MNKDKEEIVMLMNKLDMEVLTELIAFFQEEAVITQNIESNSLSDFTGWMNSLATRFNRK